LTGCAGRTDRTRCTASDRPAPSTCPPGFNRDRSILQWSLCTNGQTQRSDVLHATIGRDSASVRSRSREVPESSYRDQTLPIACDRTRRASDQLFATLCSSGCLTERAGPTSDRTRWCETLARATLQQLLLTRRAGRAETASGPAFGHFSDLRSPPFLSTTT
jgi:hypothetical protein